MSLKPLYDKSLALVVGIDVFRTAAPLGTARYGAEEVASVLEDTYQFDTVVTLFDEDATRANIEDAYADLRYEMGPDDRFVVYWAGHGLGVEGQHRSEGFLVAHDSNLKRRTRLIKMKDIADSNYTPAKHALMIIDTCHSGYAVTYEPPRTVTPGRDPQQAIKQYLTRKAYQVIASANPLETATDAPLWNGHTPFTGSLLQALTGDDNARSRVTNLLTASSVAEYVRSSVAAFRGNWQGPQTGILPGDGGGVLVWDKLFDRDARFAVLGDAVEAIEARENLGEWVEYLKGMALNDPDMAVRQRAMELWGRAQMAQAAPPPTPEALDPTTSVTVADPPPPPPKKVERYPFEPETVLIPSGEFLMGSPTSDELRQDREPEQHTLFLDAYRIGKYPVTVAQYRAFVEAGGYTNHAYWTDAGWQQLGKEGWTEPRYWNNDKYSYDDQLPVVGVSWYECYAYTQWLSEATGRSYTLPTEAQWEKAARGGLKLVDGSDNPIPDRIWPWGNIEPTADLCNFNGNVGQTSPVTSHPAQAQAQPYGLYHMAGNVWEWCLSAWANPFTHPEQNAPEGDVLRVLRGGSWPPYYNLRLVRCYCRDHYDPHNRNDFNGFRVCAASLPF